jgi:hypothetical protein
MRTLGTGALQAAAGNDIRLSDARTPLAHNQAWSTINEYQTIDAMSFAGRVLTGGGLISLTTNTTNYDVKWGTRFIIMGNGSGTHFSTVGYFDINMPALSAVITGVGGASNRTVTANGIPLANWESLYYILPIGSNSGSIDANFRVVSYTAGLVIPNTWVKLCTRNGDGNYVEFANGISLRTDTSLNTNSFDVLGSDVSGAVATATNLTGLNATIANLNSITSTTTRYTHPTGDGNLHVPATGTTNSGKVLTAGATAGSLSWTSVGSGTVTSVSGTAPVVSSGGNAPVISMAAATTSVPGYLTAADWTTFNNKQPALGFTPYNSTNPSGYITSSSLGSYLPLAGGNMSGPIHRPQSSNGTDVAPVYDVVFSGGIASTRLASISTGNSFSTDNGTFLKFVVNLPGAASSPIDALVLGASGKATFYGSINTTNNVTAAAGIFSSSVTATSFSGAGTGLTGTAASLNIGGSASGSASWLAPHYESPGQQVNPQTYFGRTIGLKVAMTGVPNVWSDTLWINGYTGADVPNNCALHFIRNGTPRMWISAQDNSATTYGTQYEVISGYNIASQSVSYATTSGSTNSLSATTDFAIVNTQSGTAAGWYGRTGAKNAAADKATFVGTYGTVSVVGAHNNALSAWADLYVNTVDGSSGGNVKFPGASISSAGAFTATSGAFSSTLNVGGLLTLNGANTGTNTYNVLNRNAITTESTFLWQTAGAAKWYLGQRNIASEDGFSLYCSSIAKDALYFNAQGGATFAQFVSAGQPTGLDYTVAGQYSATFAALRSGSLSVAANPNIFYPIVAGRSIVTNFGYVNDFSFGIVRSTSDNGYGAIRFAGDGISTPAPMWKFYADGSLSAASFMGNSVGIVAGEGNKLGFWNNDASYSIAMGLTAAQYQYGPVTDYSIKFAMTGGTGRGFVWGQNGSTPVAALNSVSGNMQIAGTMTASGGFFNSDIRLKDIVSKDGDVILYTWKDKRDAKTHIGYVAQEVQKTYPDAIQEGNDGMLSVNYIEVLVAKVASLEKQLKDLQHGI